MLSTYMYSRYLSSAQRLGAHLSAAPSAHLRAAHPAGVHPGAAALRSDMQPQPRGAALRALQPAPNDGLLPATEKERRQGAAQQKPRTEGQQFDCGLLLRET